MPGGDHSHAQFFEAYSRELNVSVVAIRGTDVGRISDLIEDIKARKETTKYTVDFENERLMWKAIGEQLTTTQRKSPAVTSDRAAPRGEVGPCVGARTPAFMVCFYGYDLCSYNVSHCSTQILASASKEQSVVVPY